MRQRYSLISLIASPKQGMIQSLGNERLTGRKNGSDHRRSAAFGTVFRPGVCACRSGLGHTSRPFGRGGGRGPGGDPENGTQSLDYPG